jgi:hypothetical protein
VDDFALYARMQHYGTLSEQPRDVPDAIFALPSTINWMRALSIIVQETKLDFGSAHQKYASVQHRDLDDRAINTVCEQLLLSLHNLSSLRAIASVGNKADVARIGIMAWYYGIYSAASAMIAAGDGSFQDDHSSTARQWDRQFAETGRAIAPFGDRLSSLLTKTIDREMAAIKARGKHSLTITPNGLEQAWGCHAEYLNGTAKWEQANIEERIRASKEFKALGVENFRTAAARSQRDSAFEKRGIAFLHEASRYRGKANYRDALYLAYGRNVPRQLDNFITDLAIVLTAFSSMAAAFVSRRIGRHIWGRFIADIENNRSISISPRAMWQ